LKEQLNQLLKLLLLRLFRLKLLLAEHRYLLKLNHLLILIFNSMDTGNVQGPVTTGTNPSRLVALGAIGKKKPSLKEAKRSAVTKIVKAAGGKGGCGKGKGGPGDLPTSTTASRPGLKIGARPGDPAWGRPLANTIPIDRETRTAGTWSPATGALGTPGTMYPGFPKGLLPARQTPMRGGMPGPTPATRATPAVTTPGMGMTTPATRAVPARPAPARSFTPKVTQTTALPPVTGSAREPGMAKKYKNLSKPYGGKKK
jgi:hypothetical protein